jgi:SAM-dependent methyltransferase
MSTICNKPQRYIFAREYFESKDFVWGITRIISRVFHILPNKAKQFVFDMIPLTDDECVDAIKKLKETKQKSIDYKSDYDTNCEIMEGIMGIFSITLPYKPTYLDIGCNNGLLARAIAKVVDANKVCGIDIDVYPEPLIKTSIPINIKKYDGCNIPFEDNTFQFVTIFQTLHHIDNIKHLLRDIHRVTKKGGYLMIKEHNSDSDNVQKLIELEHFMCDIKENNGNIKYKISCLKSEKEWDKLFIDHGFMKVEIFAYPKEPTNTYYSIYSIKK